MSIKRGRFAALCLAATAVLVGCATPAAKFPSRHYVPVSQEMQSWGALELNDKHLRLEGFDGEMELKYVGKMPEMQRTDLSGATVYRITNADKYFKQNIARKHLCAGPARWVAVGSRSGAPAWSDEIWVTLLIAQDWTRYTREGTGYCAGGMYVLATGDQAHSSSD